jgi:NADH-quinone oxidoreductase subunit N
MTWDELAAAAPLLVLAAAAVLLMLVIVARRDHAVAVWMCAVGLIAALAAIAFGSVPNMGIAATPLLRIDGYAVFYMALLVLAALGVAIVSYHYLDARPGAVPREEYYVLLLLATLGAATTVAANHFAGFFLGLEILSVSLLGLIAYPRGAEQPLEAGVKYLGLSGVASAFLLFGIALVYAASGTLAFQSFAAAPSSELYWPCGVALVLVGVGFKLSLAPFHMWVADVYDGAPAPVTAFLAVVSKCAVFALLLRYFVSADAFGSTALVTVLGAVAVLSMLAGNLLALMQENVKRILAYSSVAHFGYALVAFLASGALAIEAVSVYLAMYAITTLGAFSIVAILSASGSEADTLADYRGLLWRRPAMALAFAMMLLSLAGIPLTLGFIAKFVAIAAGVSNQTWILIAALVLGSIIGLYYYLRIVVAMLRPAQATRGATTGRGRLAANAIVAVLTIAVLALGAYPGPLFDAVRVTAADLADRASTAARTEPSGPSTQKDTSAALPVHIER